MGGQYSPPFKVSRRINMSRKSRIIEFKIEDVDFPNKGKASFEDSNIRIKGVLPGQKVKAKITKIRNDH